MVVIRDVFFSLRENSLFLKHLNEGRPQIGEQRPLQIGLAGNGNSCRFSRALEPQFALMSTFVQIANAWCFVRTRQRPPDTITRSDLGSIRRQSEIRIRAKKCRDLLCFRLIDPDLPRAERGIRFLESVANLLPGERLLRKRTCC